MRRFARISGIALIACIFATAFTFLSPQRPKLGETSATGTQDGWVIKGDLVYQRGFLSGIAEYSISEGWQHSSSKKVLDSIKAGETVTTEAEWSIDWAELASNYIAAWILVGLVSWWWSQKEPHQPKNPLRRIQVETQQALGAHGESFKE